MEDTVQLRQSAIEKINRLPREKLIGVLDFIDFVAKSPPDLLHTPRSPAPDAFLECAGTWQFEAGELDEILQDIEHTRVLELDKQLNGLFD